MSGTTPNYGFTYPTYSDAVSNSWSTLAGQMDTALTTVGNIRTRLLHRPQVNISGAGTTLAANTTTVGALNSTTLGTLGWVSPSTWHNNATNPDQLVCPESGLYAVVALAQVSSGTALTGVYCWVTQNGTTKFGTSEGLNSNQFAMALQAVGCLDLAANDVVRIAARISAAGSFVPTVSIWKLSDL